MQPRDKWIPWYFVAFFVVIALVNAVMVTLAVRTHTGLVTDHPYEKGLAYNAVVKASEDQAALGWKGELHYADGMLHFTLRDKDKQLLPIEKATALIRRPVRDGMDFTVEMPAGKASVSFPVKGLWQVQIDAMSKGVHYQKTERMVIE